MEETHRGSLIAVGKGDFAIVSPEDFWYITYLCEWHRDKKGYVMGGMRAKNCEKHIRLHLVIAERMSLDLTMYIDHEDGDKLNCQRSNLRTATHSQNRANSKLNQNNKSGYKGVHLKKPGVWCAQINANGQKIFLGYYDTPEKAHEAYKWAAKQFFREFAKP